jgi:hypothetical protein
MDKAEVVRLHFAPPEQGGMGTVTKQMSAEVGYLFSSFYHDRDSDDVTGGATKP